MTVAQVSQGRTLADEIRRVGLLVALRGYLGEEKADDVLCSPLATKNACEGDRDVTGVPPLRLTIDEAGAIRQSGSEMSFPQLRALLLVSGARIPQSKIILTVNSDGPVANEAVAMVIAQVEKCGDSFISVLRGHTAGGIAKATDYHFSVVPAEVEPTSQAQHQPIFPADAEQVRHEGNPVVLVSLDDQGHIRFARIYRSSGYPELDASAVDAAKQWTYDPCLKNGVGFACAVHIPVNFLLTQQPIVSGS